METELTPQYFFKKFLKIPDNKWLDGDLGVYNDADGPHCALGHLGVKALTKTYLTTEVISLSQIIKERKLIKPGGNDFTNVYNLNDNNGQSVGYGKSPKERMICGLLYSMIGKEL